MAFQHAVDEMIEIADPAGSDHWDGNRVGDRARKFEIEADF